MTVPIFKLSNQIEPFFLQYSSHTDGYNSRYVDTAAILRTENPSKILPASHPGSPPKRKSDTEDALAIVSRKGRPYLLIAVTMNAN